MTRRLLGCLLLLFAAAAAADEAAVRRMLQGKLGDASIESVQKASFGDLYDVRKILDEASPPKR
jgi:hypothetical protein